MGRPSKLSERQWNYVEKRVLSGESIRAIAKDTGVTEGAIRLRVNTHTKPVKELANQIARVEAEFERLPFSTQVKVRTLVDGLKGISQHLCQAAEFGAMTAHRFSSIAHIESNKIDDTAPLDDMEALKGISVLTRMANESSEIGMNLLKANKEVSDKINSLDIVQGPSFTPASMDDVKALLESERSGNRIM